MVCEPVSFSSSRFEASRTLAVGLMCCKGEVVLGRCGNEGTSGGCCFPYSGTAACWSSHGFTTFFNSMFHHARLLQFSVAVSAQGIHLSIKHCGYAAMLP